MLDTILNIIHSLSGQTVIAGVIVESALRLIKSDKPLSIGYGIAIALHKIADIASGLASFLDKIGFQKLK